jgi:high affinity sulfate transporter 1
METPPSQPAPTGAAGWTARLAPWLPTIGRLNGYPASSLRADVVAGLTLSALMVPIGMGYATAAGLPPIAGLYATIGPLVAYFLVGPSRILVVGPDSPLLPLIASAVVPLAAADPARSIALAGALSIMVGIICLGAALARLGFLTDLLSRPVRVGYMNGIALTILVGQLPKLLGFSIDATDFIGEVLALVAGVIAGKTVPAALVIGLGSLGVILGLRLVSRGIPGVLIAIILSGLAVVVLDPILGLTPGISTVGQVPTGLPGLGIPPVSFQDLAALAPGALGIALISFADTSVVSRTFAARHGDHLQPDRELGALGVANMAAGLVGGFSCSGTATRTPLAESSGAKTQLAGLTAAGVILLLLLVAPGLLAPVPSAALAAVVISAVLGLFDPQGFARLWRYRRSEVGLGLVAFLAVVLFGALPGIAAAVGLSLLNFIRQAWRPHDAVLGRVTGVKGYHDIERRPEARQIPGLVLYRWDAPLFFANSDNFRERAVAAVERSSQPVRWLAVAAEPVTDIDTTAADTLEEVISELGRRSVDLHFASPRSGVVDQLKIYGIYQRLGADHFHPTLGSVVRDYLQRHSDVDWLDWEDALSLTAAPGRDDDDQDGDASADDLPAGPSGDDRAGPRTRAP